MTGPSTVRAIAWTASKSPGEVIGKPGLDHVDAEPGELLGDLQLLLRVQRDARRLLAVAQRRVEDQYSVGIVRLWSWSLLSGLELGFFSVLVRGYVRPPARYSPRGGRRRRRGRGEEPSARQRSKRIRSPTMASLQRMSASQRTSQRSRWPYMSLIPIGLGRLGADLRRAPRPQQPSGWRWGIVWTVIVARRMGPVGRPATATATLGGLLLHPRVGGGAIATSFTIREAYERAMASPLLGGDARPGELRLRDRARAHADRPRQPGTGAEIGIGRPDVTGAADAGLVDINNASVTALLKLPGSTGTSPPRSSKAARRSRASRRWRTWAPRWTSTAGSSRACGTTSSSCRGPSWRRPVTASGRCGSLRRDPERPGHRVGPLP